MKLSVDNGDLGVLYDGNGDIIEWPISADTETGEVLFGCYDEQGCPVVEDGEIKKVTLFFKAPLRFEPANANNVGLRGVSKIALDIEMKTLGMKYAKPLDLENLVPESVRRVMEEACLIKFTKDSPIIYEEGETWHDRPPLL